MSRHKLDGPPSEFAELVVGWDPSLAAFFVQCFRHGEDLDDAPALWRPRVELEQLEQFVRSLGCEISSELRQQLVADSEGES